MSISYIDLADKLRESLIQLLWDQWTSLGAGGGGLTRPVPFVIDPEALLLMTTRFVDEESRLQDICSDWLAKNGRLVHLQRLKNVQKNEGLADESVLSQLATRMSVSGNVNWNTLAKPDASSLVAEDPSPLKTRLALAPDPYSPENFICRMRNFFGMTARAEVIFWLFTHPSGHAAEIAREGFWLPKTVQLILGELKEAGLVSVREKGRQKIYSIGDRESWEFFNRSDRPLVWLNQPAFYRGCNEILPLLDTLAGKQQASDDLKSIIIERRMDTIRDAFARCEMLPFLSDWKEESAHGRGLGYFAEEITSLHSNMVGKRDFPRRYSFP